MTWQCYVIRLLAWFLLFCFVTAFTSHHLNTQQGNYKTPSRASRYGFLSQGFERINHCTTALGQSSSSSTTREDVGKLPWLRFNASSLFESSSETMSPSPSAKLIPLIHVYNAAMEGATAPTAVESLEIPSDAVIPETLSSVRRFVRTYESSMGHDGRFVLPSFTKSTMARNDTGTISLQANALLCGIQQPLACIRDVISCQAPGYHGIDWNGKEAVVLLPGLHDPSNSERCNYASAVLDGLPVTQMHVGSHIFDDESHSSTGQYHIELSNDVIQALRSFHLLLPSPHLNQQESASGTEESNEFSPTSRSNHFRIDGSDLDRIRAVLAFADLIPLVLPEIQDDGRNQRLLNALVDLIDAAVDTSAAVPSQHDTKETQNDSKMHLVLMCNSGSSFFLSAAIEMWKRKTLTRFQSSPQSPTTFGDSHESLSRAEDLLRDSLTVVTYGALCRTFPDGPAYLHVSMFGDLLTKRLGVTEQSPNGGGKDAVYLHSVSPWYKARYDKSSSNDGSLDYAWDHDAHNMNAGLLQLVSLILRINGLRSFRDLYRDASTEVERLDDVNPNLFAVGYQSMGRLELPPRLDDELLPSMIRATGGERWLWHRDAQLGEGGVDGYDSPLPDLALTEAHLLDQLGYGVYDEIYQTCCAIQETAEDTDSSMTV